MTRRLFTAPRALTLVTACVVVVAFSRIHAQRPSTSLTLQTDVIPVDVVVLDENRRPVRGLTAADFTVLENGQPRPIVAFTEVEVPGPDDARTLSGLVSAPGRDVVSNEVPAEGRLFAILLDRSVPTGPAIEVAREIARAAVRHLGPGDLAAVVRTGSSSPDSRVQGFTADRDRLLDAIDSPFPGTPPASAMQSVMPVISGECDCGLCTLEAIGHVAEAMRPASRRRKALLFIGSVLPMPEASDRCAGSVRIERERMQARLDAVNVSVHVIDPSGPMTDSRVAIPRVIDGELRVTTVPTPPAVVDQRRRDALRVLAEDSGGRLVTSVNEAARYMSAIFEESQSYYLLAFEPASAPGPAVQQINVRALRNVGRLYARSTFVRDPPPDILPAPRDGVPSDLLAALLAPIPRQGLPVRLGVVPMIGGTPRSAGVLVALQSSVGRPGRRMTAAIGVYDLEGRQVTLLRVDATVPMRGASEWGREFSTLLDLSPGAYEVRVAVKDEQAQTVGSAFTSLDMPAVTDPTRLLLAGPTVENLASTARGGPFATLLPFVPTIQRSFTLDDRVVVHTSLVSAERAPALVIGRVFDAAGALRAEHLTTMDEGTSGPVAVPLALSQLGPGRFVLRIEAVQGRQRTSHNIAFEVRP